ncbi:MAG: glycosyltransferase family 4 protein [Bacteroides sp.]|nr:glycosyltransferase family 4 protein [Bacteroides sp.]
MRNHDYNFTVCFDHLCFWEKFGGVSKYFVELMKRMPGENYKLLLKYTNNEYIGQLKDIKTHTFLENQNFRGKAKLISEVGKIFSVPSLIKGDFDIYHPTHYDCYGLNLVPKKTVKVATMHDMNYFAIPQYYSPGNRNKINQIKMAGRVDHIITVSQKSKEDLQEYLKIPEEKITVIYHGIDAERYHNAPLIPYNEPYLLFVGRRNEYKNVKILYEVMPRLIEKGYDIKLYCAGLSPTEAEMKFLSSHRLDKVVKFIQASDIELINLYRHAEAFVFPSYYEGFGLPVLEAMAAGCPTILADASCLPEISGGASLLFDPSSADDLEAQLIKILDSADVRNNLITAGNNRVSQFSWEKSASEHLDLYNKLV